VGSTGVGSTGVVSPGVGSTGVGSTGVGSLDVADVAEVLSASSFLFPQPVTVAHIAAAINNANTFFMIFFSLIIIKLIFALLIFCIYS
jgi:hypothetical protein